MLPQCFRLRRLRRSGRAAAERSRNAPGSAAWVAPFTFFTQKPADYEEALFGARAAKTQEEKKELLKTAARLFSHDYALVVATGYQPAYCFAQEGVHDTGVCTTTAEAWTPNCAWKEQ